jgi:hypothetical protein|tara:strand:+ start:66 stop:689 length:624 start_codon:yes stop_codon:yes gene_type:complete
MKSLALDSTEDRIVRLLEGNDTISQGQRGFLKSILEYSRVKGGLTNRQEEHLVRLEEKYKPENVDRRKQWVAEYDDEKKTIARVCAHYYKRTEYFSNLVERILSEPDYVPSEKQYNSMCNNKYAKKVIESTFSEPKYPVGTFVSPRASASWKLRSASGDTPCMVIATDVAPVESAAKGSKKYHVLPVGSSSIIEEEERNLKKARVPK